MMRVWVSGVSEVLYLSLGLPIVYFGVVLLFLGAVLMLFVSRERKDKEEAV